MTESNPELKSLEQAFALFTETTKSMEEAYRRLETRLQDLDQELAARNRELAFTNDYLEYILQSMSDGVIVVDTGGIITTFNRAASAVLGFSADEAVGKSFAKLFARDFTVRSGPGAMELRARDGSPMPVSERDSPIADRTDTRIGKVKVFQDLSEIEALREQVRRIDRLAAIGEMAATVAHEIRNPLGGIRGFAALLARDIDPDDYRRRLVDKILVGSDDLDQIVTELLEYTRPVELRMHMTQCADLVEAAIGYLELEGQRIAISNHVDPSFVVLCDPDKVRRVLLNLLINAVQSIDGPGKIDVQAQNDGENVTLQISDTGCGIDEDKLEKIFSPFFTTKEKGTGLGLAEAAKIVEGHGGLLNVYSQPGRGSTFSVTLPTLE